MKILSANNVKEALYYLRKEQEKALKKVDDGSTWYE